LRQLILSFGEPVESAYPAIPSPSPAELMAKRVLKSQPRANGAGRMPPGPRKKPRPKPASVRYTIRPRIIEKIRGLIHAWDEPTITWDAVRAKVNTDMSAQWTRQALSKHPRILKAFQATKKRLLEERASGTKTRKLRTRDTSIPLLQGRIRHLEDLVQQYEATVIEYEGQFARWQHNAYLAGIPLSKLDGTVHKVDRGRSDK
jgi:hypothetical protein